MKNYDIFFNLVIISLVLMFSAYCHPEKDTAKVAFRLEEKDLFQKPMILNYKLSN